jgi:hypothetical protein
MDTTGCKAKGIVRKKTIPVSIMPRFCDNVSRLVDLHLVNCRIEALGVSGGMQGFAAMLARHHHLKSLVFDRVSACTSNNESVCNNNWVDVAVNGVLKMSSLRTVGINIKEMYPETRDVWCAVVGAVGTTNSSPMNCEMFDGVASMSKALEIFPLGFGRIVVDFNSPIAANGNTVLCRLCQVLHTTTTLEYLRIRNLPIMSDAASAIGALLACNPSITHLICDGTARWGRKGSMDLVDGLRTNQRLRYLEMMPESGWRPDRGVFSRLLWNLAHGAVRHVHIRGLDCTDYTESVPLGWHSDPIGYAKEHADRFHQSGVSTIGSLWAEEGRYMPSWNTIIEHLPEHRFINLDLLGVNI